MLLNTSRRCIFSSLLQQAQAPLLDTAYSDIAVNARHVRPPSRCLRSIKSLSCQRSSARQPRASTNISSQHNFSLRALGRIELGHQPLFAAIRLAASCHVRYSSSQAARNWTKPEIRAFAKYRVTTQELKNLVNIYSWNDEAGEAGSEHSFAPSKRDEITEDKETSTHSPSDETAQTLLNTLNELLDHEESSHQQIYDIYRSFPEPRATQLPRETLDRLLNHLSAVEYSTEASMLRYLSVVEDVKAAGRKIRIQHWNSVIHLTTTCVKRINEQHVESAMEMLREMEQQAGVQADHVTFNILFDVATKSGKFLLADMIYDEMKTRGLEYTRYFRTSLIYHHGLRHDGDGVRKAYMDLVDAGEFVDTTVINCVIAAFLHCGEASAAEQTFERAKQLHAAKTNQQLPPPDWRAKRKLGRRLERAASFKRIRTQERKSIQIIEGPFSSNYTSPIPQLPASRSSTLHAEVAEALTDENLEEDTSIAPDLQTFKVLIYHHSIKVGDIDRAANLVDEMEHYGVALHGSIFLYLFKAFGIHGGILYTQWTLRRLENTWTSYIKAVDDDDGAGLVYISRAAGQIAAKAYLQCAGPGRAAEIWVEARSRIRDASEEQLEDYDHDISEIMGEHVGLFWDVLEWSMKDTVARQNDEQSEPLREEGFSGDDDSLVHKSNSEDVPTKANT